MEHQEKRQRWWEVKREALLALGKETPVYVYDEATISSSIATLKSLSALNRVFYALKANPNPDGRNSNPRSIHGCQA